VDSNTLQTNLKIIHLNIRSYGKNQPNFWTLMENLKSKFHIIVFTETWSTLDTEELITYPGYKTYAKSRVNGIRGGVAILIDDSLHSHPVDCKCSFVSEVEHLMISVSLKANSSVLIGSVYRPPGSDPYKFNTDMLALLNSTVCLNKVCYICGDFNLNLMNYASHAPTNEFLNNMFSSGFRPLITCPTRLTGHSSTLIDNIFSNALSYKENSGILYADISDHLPIFVILDCKIRLLPKPKLVSFRIKSEQASINFHTFIENETWDDAFAATKPDDILTLINDKLSSAYNNYFPLKQAKPRRFKTIHKPWLSVSLLKSCKKKNKLYKNYLKTGSPDLLKKYSKYKNKLTDILRKAEKQYYASKLEIYKDNLKELWGVLKEALHQKVSYNRSIPLRINDKIVEDPLTIANTFNAYFATLGEKMAAKILPSPVSHQAYLKEPLINSMFLTPTNEIEIQNIIAEFKKTSLLAYLIYLLILLNVLLSVYHFP